MKTLKTRRVNIVLCWNSLKRIPPKEFPSIDEMEITADILETLKEAIPEFVKLVEEGEQLYKDIQGKKLNGEQIKEKQESFQSRSTIIEEQKGESSLEIEFENAAFNTFFQLFERWGKNWFQKVDAFLAFRKDVNDANQQTKGKK